MKSDALRHGSLFSGIGGFDLAAAWMGWENVFRCEIDPFCQKILAYYFPNAKSYGDIRKTDFTVYRGKVDILTGGFPCQPFSLAGKGKGTDDERHLWPHMLRAIREVAPRWVVAENVRGIISWNEGLVFEQVCADLEAEGYNVQPTILPAAGVGAPHRRDRVWFIAYSKISGDRGELSKLEAADGEEWQPEKFRKGYPQPWNDGKERYATDTNGHQRCKRRLHANQSKASERYPGLRHTWHCRDPWKDFPSEPPVCPGDDGFPHELDNITLSKWRRESIKAAGNAIVPQVAVQIFRAIVKMENLQINDHENWAKEHSLQQPAK